MKTNRLNTGCLVLAHPDGWPLVYANKTAAARKAATIPGATWSSRAPRRGFYVVVPETVPSEAERYAVEILEGWLQKRHDAGQTPLDRGGLEFGYDVALALAGQGRRAHHKRLSLSPRG